MSMKLILLVALGLVALPFAAGAQGHRSTTPRPRLRIAVGVSTQLDTRLHAEATQNLMGQELASTIDAAGTATLEVTAVGRDDVTWRYGVPDMKLTVVSPLITRGNGGAIDTVIALGPLTIVTDRKGVVQSESGVAPDANPIAMLLDQAMQGDWTAVLFSPLIERGATPGETWSIRIDDSTESGTGEAGASVARRAFTRVYTYDGVVDTLGQTTMRVRSRIDSMRISGDVTSMSLKMQVEGDGAQVSTAYYDAVTGILVAATIDSETSLVANVGGGQMQIPMTYRTRYTAVGKGLHR